MITKTFHYKDGFYHSASYANSIACIALCHEGLINIFNLPFYPSSLKISVSRTKPKNPENWVKISFLTTKGGTCCINHYPLTYGTGDFLLKWLKGNIKYKTLKRGKTAKCALWAKVTI